MGDVRKETSATRRFLQLVFIIIGGEVWMRHCFLGHKVEREQGHIIILVFLSLIMLELKRTIDNSFLVQGVELLFVHIYTL